LPTQGMMHCPRNFRKQWLVTEGWSIHVITATTY